MITKLRKRSVPAITSQIFLWSFLFQIISPATAFALTGGPSQPEVESFEPIGTNQMVDAFTGDFTYNIPLMDIDGYPINISYHSGITMDQEASWVGLGWNINPGSITRGLRGIPDDFGNHVDRINYEFNMKPNKTYGVNAIFGAEIFGFDAFNLSFGLGINYNNYAGVGLEQFLSAGINLTEGSKGPMNANLGLSLKSSSKDGLDVTPSLGLSRSFDNNIKSDGANSFSTSVGVPMNSRSGLKAVTITPSVGYNRADAGGKLKKLGMDKRSMSMGGAISLTPNTYYPVVNMAKVNKSFYFSAKVGGEFFGGTGTMDLAGYYSEQKLDKKEKSAPAYGYLYHDQAAAGNKWNAVLDFNREKDVPYTRERSNLNLTNFTYDTYTITGQGIGGSYRPYRGDIPALFDAKAEDKSFSGNFGGEFAAGNFLQGGLDITLTDVKTRVGVWEEDNASLGLINGSSNAISDPLFEKFYFKAANEFTPVKNQTYFNNIGGEDVVSIPIDYGNWKYDTKTLKQFKKRSGTASTLTSSDLAKTTRPVRNQPITYILAKEVGKFGITKYNSPFAPGHHISEIITTKDDGWKYAYGIAAYNTTQKEATFNVSGNTIGSNGQVTYTSQNASIHNAAGVDGYYQATNVPAYAHSYLLTSIVSSDYIDINNDGPTDDDLGTYTKFDYSKRHSDYKWRTPYTANQAKYNEGLKSDLSDDKGSFVYGTKELWYLNTIQSRNHIAVFHKSDRKDGISVAGESGGIGTDAMQRLDSISLYSKADYLANNTNAEVLKRVHFEYDYSLCQGIENNNGDAETVNGQNLNQGGKLTLRKVYFTYKKANSGRFNSYTFQYGDLDNDGTEDSEANPDYDPQAYDRWGMYKPTPTSSSVPTNSEFPYTSQDNTLLSSYNSGTYQYRQVDINAAAWSLSTIALPSGGEIFVQYESDDYAYVQDKRAAEMFKIKGAGTSATASNSQLLFTTSGLGFEHRDYLYFDLKPEHASDAQYNVNDLKRDYFNDNVAGKLLYFRFLVDLMGSETFITSSANDFVSGYAEIEDVGLRSATEGYIRVKKARKGDWSNPNAMVNPIAKAAWHFVSKHNPRVANGQGDPVSNPGNVKLLDVMKALTNSSLLKNIFEFFDGPNSTLEKKLKGANFFPEFSWVRLDNPIQSKLGGGSRVKQIMVSDEWSSMTGNGATAVYGQSYEYKTEENISSGVAAYEPMLGGDENPFRTPIFTKTQNLLAPDDEHYIEKPLGESFFPGPTVGYSRVKVNALNLQGVNAHGTGYSVQEFYTARDFPTRTSQTDLEALPAKTGDLSNILKLSEIRDHVTTSQGYLIETNDMHGKPRKTSEYSAQSTLISSSEYKYQTKQISKAVNSTVNISQEVLDNDVTVINKNGTIGSSQMGVDIDLSTDFRQSETKSRTLANNGNLNSFLAFILPLAVVTVIPNLTKQETRYRSAVATKVIRRSGILRKIIQYDMGSEISTENVAYDAETGQVLLTSFNNEYLEPVYNFTFPAHWAYKGMEQAYKNFGLELAGLSTDANGIISSTHLMRGDQLHIYDPANSNINGRAWVWATDFNAATPKYLIDEDGALITSLSNFTAKVISPGRKNQHGISIGQITTRTNPLDGLTQGVDRITFTAADEILSAGANEYSEEWKSKDLWDYQNSFKLAPGAHVFIEFLNIMFEHFYKTQNHVGYSNSRLALPNYKSGFALSSNPYRAIESSLTQFVYDNLAPQVYNNTPKSSGPFDFWFVHNGKPDDPVDFLNFSVKGKTYDENGMSDCGIELIPQAGKKLKDIAYIVPEIDPSTGLIHNQNSINPFGQQSIQQLVLRAYYKNSGGNPIPGTLTISFACSTGDIHAFLENVSQAECDDPSPSPINPYLNGVRGNYRPTKSYTYKTDRQLTTSTNNNVNLREDGIFTGFSEFWQPAAMGSDEWTPNISQWTYTSEVTLFDKNGNGIETRDAIGNYQAVKFRYANKLPVMVADNARQYEIYNESFEDFDYVHQVNDCNFYSTNLRNYTYDIGAGEVNRISNEEAHTGRYSLKLEKIDPVSAPAAVIIESDDELVCTGGSTNTVPFAPGDCEQYIDFTLGTGTAAREYIMSLWVKDKVPANAFDYSQAIQLSASAGTVTLLNKSDIIEGWQRLEYLVNIPANTVEIDITLDNGSGHATGDIVYVDDLRLHPVESNTKTYVYDPVNFRYMAELDENNFATFYEYNAEGKLSHIKKETSKGIVTIQESQSDLISKYNQ